MAFENHVATVVCDTKDVYILDWRDKSGTNEYYVRYIVDKKMGSLIIQGDLGTAVACWYGEVTPKNLVGYVGNVPYFASKLLCSTDKYVYEDEDIKADIVERFDNFAVGYDGDALKEVMDDCYAVVNAIIDAHHNNYLYCQDDEKGTFTILPYEKDMYEYCCEKFKTRESWQDLVRL